MNTFEESTVGNHFDGSTEETDQVGFELQQIHASIAATRLHHLEMATRKRRLAPMNYPPEWTLASETFLSCDTTNVIMGFVLLNRPPRDSCAIMESMVVGGIACEGHPFKRAGWGAHSMLLMLGRSNQWYATSQGNQNPIYSLPNRPIGMIHHALTIDDLLGQIVEVEGGVWPSQADLDAMRCANEYQKLFRQAKKSRIPALMLDRGGNAISRYLIPPSTLTHARYRENLFSKLEMP